MEAPPTESSINKISAVYAHHAALYAPSVTTEAARLLDALLDTAEQHGYPRTSDDLGTLATAAAYTVSRKYGRPATERQYAEITQLHRALAQALTEEGLTITGCHVRMGVAVEPLADGPRWGWDGTAGLAVALYSDGGWDLMVNQTRTRVFTIHAPDTADGAREIAAIVHSILRGDLPDPFRASSR